VDQRVGYFDVGSPGRKEGMAAWEIPTEPTQVAVLGTEDPLVMEFNFYMAELISLLSLLTAVGSVLGTIVYKVENLGRFSAGLFVRVVERSILPYKN